MQFNIISPSRFKTVPWKNGRGSTKELLFENIKGEDSFAWRLSMAPVTSDGIFSDFSGYDRTLILVEGNGITLSYDNGQLNSLNKRFDLAQFDGGWTTEATLQRGEITDFNVITRQGVCAAHIDILRENGEHRLTVDTDLLLIYPLDDAIELLTPILETMNLAATNLLQVISPPAGVWEINGEAVICIQIHYLTGVLKDE